ncbi:hypothetical protein NX773_07115 [Massilia solisilvae]|uniref:Uncharacterized protein n=1 Tax=Massilia solisilvae TaxID=1811225 RepID=A0ABT2BHD9_9BURK|nr:hypothetical protein [Massilia solisilvae]MCS0607930.1 hypothetical protein [Massilia solisilvae]
MSPFPVERANGGRPNRPDAGQSALAERLRERLRTLCPPAGTPFADTLQALPASHDQFPATPLNVRRLAVAPLRSVGSDRAATECAQALQAELEHRLHGVFGAQVVPYGPAAAGATHVIEACLRVDGDRLRTTVRLVDRLSLCIPLSEQFDAGLPFGIAQQEFLALSICRAIQNHFSLR